MAKFVNTAGIAYVNDGRIFLVKPFDADRSAETAWCIPKGHCEPGEMPDETAKREFREETGIEAPEKLHYLCDCYCKFKDTTKRVIVYRGVGDPDAKFAGSNLIDQGPSKGNPENVEGRYFTYDEAMSKIMRYQIPIIENLRNLESTFEGYFRNLIEV